ncbi:MAG: protein kinase domain-containing protein, partial [Pseudomonadota bacterium]
MADRPKPEPHGREQLQHLSRLTTPPLPREPLAWDLAASTDAASKTDEPRPPVDVPGLDLLMPIGSGSYGTVWIARNREVGMCQACKLIPPDCAAELDGLRGLVTRVPPHDALMPIHHVARVGDWIYCTMPLADDAGTRTPDLGDRPYVALTLAEYIRRHGRRPAAEVARIGAELAGGLDHLRMHGVKHGDVKPSNIARHRGLWRLMDYGLVHELSAKVGACTAAYSAPEGPGHPT